MPIQSIPCGMVVEMAQGVVYGLPSVKCQLLSEAVLQRSATSDGTFANLAGSNVEPGVLIEGGGFVKCATGIANVIVKKHLRTSTVAAPEPPAEPTYQETIIADGAIAYWPLDEVSGTTANDKVGSKNGTISGGVTLEVNGVGRN